MAKYKTEINLHGLAVSMCENNNVQTLEEILQYSRKMVEKYEQNIAKVTQVNNDTKYSYFFTAYLMLAIERSALLLEGCVKVRSYTAFSKYKEL